MSMAPMLMGEKLIYDSDCTLVMAVAWPIISRETE